ncbi:MAG: hypothetical protein AAGG51_15665 [Cyanobacteria bacterium P01_G01_bin.54]
MGRGTKPNNPKPQGASDRSCWVTLWLTQPTDETQQPKGGAIAQPIITIAVRSPLL